MLEEFLNSLFKDQTGYVYAPHKRTKDFRWKQSFFKWPEEKDNLITYYEETKDSSDVYISPVLFSEQRVSPKTFKGTFFVWSEFDGKIPENLGDVPYPSIRIQSSTSEHQHWYWELDDFVTDPELIQTISKKLTYALNADQSGWDYAQVLRPPDTTHHDSGLTTQLLEVTEQLYPTAEFDVVSEPPEVDVGEINGKLPNVEWLLAKYKWSYDSYDLLYKTIEKGKRDEAYTRLAFECIEMGMSNKEILSVLFHADDNWGKFVKRNDRKKRLTRILTYARTQKASQESQGLATEAVVYGFFDFMRTEVKLEWVIPGVLSVAGCGVTFGPPGIGKSTWMLRMGMEIATGDTFLNWKIERNQKVLFLSLEMPHDELKEFFNDMQLPVAKQQELNERFLVAPYGHAWPLDNPVNLADLLYYIDVHKIEMVIIDSLGIATTGNVSSDEDIMALNNILNKELRISRGVSYWFVHFPRKPSKGEMRKAEDLYDMFGSIYISQNAQTVINLEDVKGNDDKVKVNIFKSRLSQDKRSFSVERLQTRDFKLLEKGKPNVSSVRRETAKSDSVLPGTGGKITPFGGGHRG